MKVLHCFWAYLATTENWAYKLITNLSGVENFIATERFLKNNFYSKELTYLEYPLKYFPNDTNTKWLNTAYKINRFFLKIYTYERFILQNAKFHQVQLLHSHFGTVGWQYHTVAKKLDVPHVISFYGRDYQWVPFNEPVWKERYQLLFSEAAAFICEGKHGLELLEKSGCPRDKIHVVKLSVETDDIPYFKREKKSNSLKLIQVASFNEKKGHIYSIMALKKALDHCPNLQLTFVGDISGDSAKKVVDYVKNENLSDKVNFIGSIEYENLHLLLRDYHVFIHPSNYTEDMDCEGGAPIVLLDAQATGMPVISTNHCDIPGEVIHGVTGLLADERNVDEIFMHIKTFYEMNNEAYEQYSINARKHVEANFNSKKNSMALQEVYKTLIG